MSATPETPSLTTAGAPIVDRIRRSAQGLAPQRRGRPAIDQRGVPRRLVTVLMLAVCVVTVLLAVPDLRPVAGEIADMNPALVAAAVGLELASCLSFVVIFRLFFRPIPRTVAREMAWSQMGSGALLPGGGVGSLAVGGWLLHLAGMSAQQIVRRSSGLFFLTSAVNVFTLAAAGLLLLLGVGDGPHDVLRAGLPVIVALAAIILVLGLPKVTRQVSREHPRAAWLDDVGIGIPAARHALVRPSWRLVGALGYLLFDVAVLWTTFAAVGPLPPLAPLVIAYLAGYLANAIPIPGGIGVLDSGLVGALALYGLTVTHAAAAVLVYHAIAFWIPTLGGTLAYARLRPRLVVIDEREIAPRRPDPVGMPTPSEDDVQSRPIAAGDVGPSHRHRSVDFQTFREDGRGSPALQRGLSTAPPNPSPRPFIRLRATGPFWSQSGRGTGSQQSTRSVARGAGRMLALVREHDAEQTLLEPAAHSNRPSRED